MTMTSTEDSMLAVRVMMVSGVSTASSSSTDHPLVMSYRSARTIVIKSCSILAVYFTPCIDGVTLCVLKCYDAHPSVTLLHI